MNTNKPSPPDISVCIANYNGGDLVLECLESVYAQEGGFRIEVLVHDDASKDDSLARIQECFPQVQVIASVTNVGFCISNNRMAARATGRYLLLLNNDAKLRPDSLQALFAAAENGMEDCILGLPQCSMADDTIIDRGYRTDLFLNPIPIMAPGVHEAGVATGACLWIPRNVWNEVGGFPDWFESVAEDIFICFAARLLGHRVVVLDAPAFDHWIGKNLGGGKLDSGKLHSSFRRRRLSERNKTFAMLCCYPWLALLVLLPLHVLSLMVEATFLLVAMRAPGKVGAIYKEAFAGQWRHWRQVAELRGRLMRNRRASTARFFAFTDWIPVKLVMLFRHGTPRLD